MAHQFTTSYLKDAVDLFRYYKRLGDGAGTSEAVAARESTGPGFGEPGDKLRSRA